MFVSATGMFASAIRLWNCNKVFVSAQKLWYCNIVYVLFQQQNNEFR